MRNMEDLLDASLKFFHFLYGIAARPGIGARPRLRVYPGLPARTKYLIVFINLP